MAVVDRPNGAVSQQETMDVINPVTQEVVGAIPMTSPEAVEAAVERARFAQIGWGKLSVSQRTRFIRRWLDLVWENQSEAIKVLRRENGKSDGSAFAELMAVDGIGQYYINRAEGILKPKRRGSLVPGVQWAKVFYKPHGVIGQITPWNYPFALPFMDMLPALIAGNTIVLKPSEITPFIAEFGVDLMYEAGIPRDVVQIVHGAGRTGAALVDYVDYVQFTGSTAVGRKVGQRAAERLIPFSLELGGKDPSIVLADADPELAALGLIQGAFENSGQMCISIERVYVEAPIYDALIEQLKHYAPQMTFSPDDGYHVVMGSMTNTAELERTRRHVEDAIAKGAEVIHGGQARPDIGPLFHEPTILVNVDHTMDVMTEETFGPLLPIMKVNNAEEAVQLANDNEYGLSASIFAKDLKRAQEIAVQIDSGDVSVNRAQWVTATPNLPMGGQRNSGLGRRNGPEGLLKYTASQSVLLDNLIGFEKSVVPVTPRTIQLVEGLRRIRRHIPFV